MPVYCYKCEACGGRLTKINTIDNRDKGGKCCGQWMSRDITAEGVNSTDAEYAKPILSESAGVGANQVTDFKRRHPNIPITDDGRVIFTSHNQRKKALKEMGFFDRDGYS